MRSLRVTAFVAVCMFIHTAAAACGHGKRHEALINALAEEFPNIATTLEPMCADKAVLAPPSPIKTWRELEQVVNAPDAIARAEALFQKEYTTLAMVAANSKVPESYLLGIIMVETLGGTHLGTYPVIDTLYNRFEYGTSKQRIDAVRQLGSFLKSNAWAPSGSTVYTMRGSSAGAFGLGQFMPYSFEHHAVDGDGDGVIDLFAVPDAAASIAKHLTDNGWRESRVQALFRYNKSRRYGAIVTAIAARFASFAPPAAPPTSVASVANIQRMP